MNRCPECGSPALIQERRDLKYRYLGKSNNLSQVNAYFCTRCDEIVLPMDQAVRAAKAMLNFNRTINAEIIKPDYITRMRTKLKLDLGQAAAIFGESPDAFERYEAGNSRPTPALVKLLQLLYHLLHLVDSNEDIIQLEI